MTADQPSQYVDESGTHYGYCNSCGEEADLFVGECCYDGEIVPYDDDRDPDDEHAEEG